MNRAEVIGLVLFAFVLVLAVIGAVEDRAAPALESELQAQP